MGVGVDVAAGAADGVGVGAAEGGGVVTGTLPGLTAPVDSAVRDAGSAPEEVHPPASISSVSQTPVMRVVTRRSSPLGASGATRPRGTARIAVDDDHVMVGAGLSGLPLTRALLARPTAPT